MRAFEAAFKFLFYLTTVSSAAGFYHAKSLHESNGPSLKIARFSVFMGYSFGIYLFTCLALAAYFRFSGHGAPAALLFFSFCLPFALANLSTSYEQADSVFNLQIAGMIVSAAALLWMTRSF